MSLLVAPAELEPLASAPLRRRFPQLETAMDADIMRERLQGLLLDGNGLSARACGRPKAEVNGNVCWFQYPLQVSTPSGGSHEILVLGAMFAESRSAARFERDTLAPLAARSQAFEGATPKPTGLLESLGMAVSVFPVNGLLPTLVDLTDPQRVAPVVRSILSSEHQVEVTGVDLVVFRRTGGCVLRYHLAQGADRTVVYGKVGSAARAEVVQEGLYRLAGHTLPRNRGTVVVPSVLGHSAELDLTLITGVPGARPDLRIDGVLDAIVDKAAFVAAFMHTSGVRAGSPRTMKDELGRARDAVGRIGLDAPAFAAWLTAVLDSVTEAARRTPTRPLAFAHGDFTLSQLLMAGLGVGVLDFDGLCQAEPACDLGRFLASLRTVLAKSGNPSGDRLASRFLDVYQAVGGQTNPEDRARVYELTSLVRMAAHSWQRLKASRLRVVCSVLERQVAELGLTV
jgi:hypothetical protein